MERKYPNLCHLIFVLACTLILYCGEDSTGVCEDCFDACASGDACDDVQRNPTMETPTPTQTDSCIPIECGGTVCGTRRACGKTTECGPCRRLTLGLGYDTALRGQGTVMADPDIGNCTVTNETGSTECTFMIEEGTEVSLRRIDPDDSCGQSQWGLSSTSDCGKRGHAHDCMVTITHDMNVYAHFLSCWD